MISRLVNSERIVEELQLWKKESKRRRETQDDARRLKATQEGVK